MTFDVRTGMSLEWNDLGLVEKVSLNDTVLVNYSYLATMQNLKENWQNGRNSLSSYQMRF